MYTLVASCVLVSLAASGGRQHQAQAFSPLQGGSPAERPSNPATGRGVNKPLPEGGGCPSDSTELRVSAAPLDVSLEEPSVSTPASDAVVRPPNAPLTDDDIERQLENHLLEIRRNRKRASSAAVSATKKKRKPRIVRSGRAAGVGGVGGVPAIEVVDAPRQRRILVPRKVTIGDAPGTISKTDAVVRLTREEEAQISSDVRSLRAAVRVRDELALALGREPTEREWADACGGDSGGDGDEGLAIIKSVLNLRRVMHSGREARSRLVAANAGLVASMARKYSAALKSSAEAGGGGGVGSILTVQDLVQEGNLGLMEAAERFEPERGFRFSTYASHWVRQRMLRSIADYSRVIRLPAHVHSTLRSIRKARRRLEKDLGRPPSDDEVSSHLDLPLDKLRLYAGSARNVLSLEAPADSSSSSSSGKMKDDRRRVLGDVIASRSPTPEEDALSDSLRRDIRAAVDGCLSDRERDVLVLRFGLEGGSPRSVGETATELGVSRDRVRTVEAKALNKLRHPRKNHRLKEYVSGGCEEEDEEEAPAAAAADVVVGSSPESLWSF